MTVRQLRAALEARGLIEDAEVMIETESGPRLRIVGVRTQDEQRLRVTEVFNIKHREQQAFPEPGVRTYRLILEAMS